jgi:sugar phosphate isomerase/epimerase
MGGMPLRISGIADEAGRDIATQIRAHRELGWTHLDLRAVDGVNVTSVSDAAFEDIGRKIQASGLQVANFASGVCCWGRTVKDDFRVDFEELRRAIPRMRRLGTDTIRVMSCPQPAGPEAPEPAYTEEVFRRLRELARMAEAGGVTLVHENVGTDWTRNDPDRMLRLVDAVDSPNFRLLFDMGNFGGGDPAEETLRVYERIREKIAYVHLKDCAPDGQNTWAGEGVVPIRELLKRMVRDGYDGYVSMEPHIAALHHTGKTAAADVLYATYIRNGRLVSALVREANAGRDRGGKGK